MKEWQGKRVAVSRMKEIVIWNLPLGIFQDALDLAATLTK
jgi:hypothetical protein